MTAADERSEQRDDAAANAAEHHAGGDRQQLQRNQHEIRQEKHTGANPRHDGMVEARRALPNVLELRAPDEG